MSEQLRQEFNQWAMDGRAAALESPHRNFAEELIRLMQIAPRDRILELGCGEGWALRTMAALAPEGTLVGLDVSDAMIRRARAQGVSPENLLYIWSSAEEIPWQENFFTKAFSLEAFYYFEHPEKALREIHRVLAPGGSLWIVNHLSKENELSLRWIPELKVPVQILPAEQYGALLEQCGYENFSHRMIPERRPVPDETPAAPFRDAAELRRFYEAGALLLSARKPAEPPPQGSGPAAS